MAEVDFSNAVLAPYNSNNYCPVGLSNLSFDLNRSNIRLVNASGQRVTASDGDDISVITNTDNELLLRFFGTFGTSGTEFYFYRNPYGIYWKMSNISFSSGDTYDFTIDCTLLNSFAS